MAYSYMNVKCISFCNILAALFKCEAFISESFISEAFISEAFISEAFLFEQNYCRQAFGAIMYLLEPTG
jgi:hypothetical protein